MLKPDRLNPLKPHFAKNPRENLVPQSRELPKQRNCEAKVHANEHAICLHAVGGAIWADICIGIDT